MTVITGVVESKRKDNKAIKVNGVWYSAYSAATLAAINDGDVVTFESQASPDGRWQNIKGKVTVDATGAMDTPVSAKGPALQTTVNSRYTFPIPATDSQRSILRQNALTNAREVVCAQGWSEDDVSLDDVAKVIINIARKFEEYTSGDSDMELAKEKLSKMEVK